MNSKRVRFYRILPTLMLGGIFIFSGCDKSNDVFNPDRIQEEAKKAFPVKDIDPNQTWEMSAICNASVSVNEKTGGIYTIKVYTANPYNTNGNAFLLAKASVTDGQTVNFKFDIPAALQLVYVMKINSEGYSSAIPVTIENETIKTSFGETDMTKSTRATLKSSIVEFQSPDINDTSIFPTKESIKSLNLKETNGDIGTAGNYKIDSKTKNINNWASNANMYVTENVTLSLQYIASNSHLYILPGVELTMTNGYSLTQNGNLISIGSNAILNINGKLQIQATLYNLGILNISNNELETSTNGYLYNTGAITSKKTSITNSTFANEGKLKSIDFEAQGGAKFYNNGEVYISNNTLLGANNQEWENQNYFETTNMEIRASSPKILNACKLFIKDLFYINISQDNESNYFAMNGGSYVECDKFKANNARVYMGENSFFKIKDTATYQFNPGGFYNNNDNYALIQIGKAIAEQHGKGNTIGYHGKLYIASDDHFEDSMDSSVHCINIDNGAQMTGANNAKITIDNTPCNPGYNGSTPDGGGDDKVQNYAYVFEDMAKDGGDYDFNDVVLYVTSPLNGKITATLKAAGATKQLAIRFKNKKTGEDKIVYDDVHTALGVAAGTITNTGVTTGKKAETKTFDVGNDFSITEDADFYIVNKKDNIGIHIAEFTDGFTVPYIPYAIRIAYANWKWPKERTDITKAYTKFAGWAQDMTSNLDWYSNPESVVNDNVIGIE